MIKNPETFKITKKDLKEIQEKLTNGEEPDVIAFGCPHCSYDEIQDILKNINTSRKILICTSKKIKKRIKQLPSNVKIVADTYMVVAPVEEMGIKCLATDSAKSAYYTQNLSKIKSV